MEWQDYVNEVETKGFGKASPIARLIWSCEVGKIDQHASPDLDVIAEIIEAARGLVDYRRRVGPLNFQLEKADGFIRRMSDALEGDQ